jgi:hypothetical protein
LKQGALLAWRGRIPTFRGAACLESDLAFLVPKMTHPDLEDPLRL